MQDLILLQLIPLKTRIKGFLIHSKAYFTLPSLNTLLNLAYIMSQMQLQVMHEIPSTITMISYTPLISI